MANQTLVTVGLALATSGCFASWAGVQAGGAQHLLEEGTRKSTVPLPGVQERLRIRLPLELAYAPRSYTSTSSSTTTGAAAPASPRKELPFELGCQTTQHARDTVYRSAFRYGTAWKYGTAAMFVLEAATASAMVFLSDRSKPENMLVGGLVAADALGTAALFFAPRREVYRNEILGVSSVVRGDCPDGLVLDIGGEVFPIDAAGRIGELGVAALDGWMDSTTPTAPLQLTYGGQTMVLRIGPAEQCVWNTSHHPDRTTPCPRYGGQREVFASLELPMGTWSRVD